MRRLCLAAVAATATSGLAGCGGGITIGFGSGFDDPPSVSLAVSADAAPAGAVLRLAAAAADDYRVVRVQFWRREADGRAVLLAEDTSAPYDATTVVPTDGRPTLQLFARAVDDIGQTGDSALVVVTVLR